MNNAVSSRQGTAVAIAQVSVSSAKWIEEASEALRIVATTNGKLTSDNVWEYLHNNNVEDPYEHRAMGPVMRGGVKAGWISPTSEFEIADNPKTSRNHGRPQRVYESLLLV